MAVSWKRNARNWVLTEELMCAVLLVYVRHLNRYLKDIQPVWILDDRDIR